MIKTNNLIIAPALLLLFSCFNVAMQDPTDFRKRLGQNYEKNDSQNTLDLLLESPREREQKEFEGTDKIMARLYIQAQRNRICMHCTAIVCLGCCCTFLYYLNQTAALSKRCSH